MNKKIYIILPHKDQFIKNYAGSASIWVKDFLEGSKFKTNIKVIGSTSNKKHVYSKKNYININISKFKFASKSDSYTKKIINLCYINKPSIIEIHNRPTYLLKIYSSFKESQFVLIFHNDPLSQKGSISIKERKFLLNICSKIYFVSSWVEEKFFEGIDKNFYSNFKTIYPSIKPIKKFPKKEKLIVFSGKLNKAKGFDKFSLAIIKILNKYKDWKSIVMGDEPRERHDFNHKNLKFTGWIPQDQVLKIYDKSSITIVPSLWEEPFGRSSLEAGSRGNAVILSKKGGLPETISSPIFLKNISAKSIYDEIERLIKNKKRLNKIQKDLFYNPLHILNRNTEILDNDRSKLLDVKKNLILTKTLS